MGFMDKVKGWFGGQKDEATQDVDKAAAAADDKPGGSPADQIPSAADQPKEPVEKLGDDG